MYRCVIKLRYTPLLWKDTKVIFIPKPGKQRYDTPKSFRPISLSNYFLKTLEKLMNWKIDEDLPKHLSIVKARQVMLSQQYDG